MVQIYRNVDDDIKNSESLEAFKKKLNKNVDRVPDYFSGGDRQSQIHHVRMRMHRYTA